MSSVASPRTSRADLPRELRRYLLDGEKLVTAVHQHWAKVIWQVTAAVAAFIVALWADFSAPRSAQPFVTLLWVVFFGVLVWAAYHVVNWRLDWFVATDKRLLLFHGFITRQVSMMPLIKVTDMSYHRSIPGRMLKYGRFVMESAGQDQALGTINFVPRPTHHYRAICAEIFGVDDMERVVEVLPEDDDPYAVDVSEWPEAPLQQFRDDRPGGGEEGGTVHYEAAHLDPTYDSTRDPVRHFNPVTDYRAEQSRAIPLRWPGRQRGDRGSSIYRSPDLVKRDRDADTGPIPLRPRFPGRPRRIKRDPGLNDPHDPRHD